MKKTKKDSAKIKIKIVREYLFLPSSSTRKARGNISKRQIVAKKERENDKKMARKGENI